MKTGRACAPRANIVAPVVGVLMAAGLAASASAENRSFDGTGNNLADFYQGSTGSMLLRQSAPAYTDTFSAMPRMTVNARDVSNAVATQTAPNSNARGLSDMIWQWGQFVDHDLDLTTAASGEAASISTSGSDPYFLGTPINFTRSTYMSGTGDDDCRQQANFITSYLDGSNVYGSSQYVADGLRTFNGGKLRTSSNATGDLLPINTTNLPVDPGPFGTPATSVFVAGDIRANEQSGLTAMHTLFMREHNRWADTLAAANPSWSDEEIYQMSRKLVGAEIQKITYADWLPALLGDSAMGSYGGYDSGVDSTISTEFSTAAFRIGHTMLSSTLHRMDDNGNTIAQGNLSLLASFFNPSSITSAGIDPILKGLASSQANEIDTQVIDDVRNFLFGPPGAGGMDLAALNIQRSRDHGLCDYNLMRTAYGLAAVNDFSDITSDPVLAAALASVYGSVDSIDPWVGMLAEDHMNGSSVGELMTVIIADQFERTRAGDRFWYEIDADLTPYLDLINTLTLGDIIELNTTNTQMQGNVFFVVPAPSALAMLGLGGLAATRRKRRA